MHLSARIYQSLAGLVLSWDRSCLAQDAPASGSGRAETWSSLELALWPEYDRPEMLVIYRGAFARRDGAAGFGRDPHPGARGQRRAPSPLSSQGGERLNQEYTTRLEGD